MQANHLYNVCIVPYFYTFYDKVLLGHLLPYQHWHEIYTHNVKMYQ